MASSGRITIPGDLGNMALVGEQDFGPSSEIRRMVPPGAVPWLVVTYDQLVSMPLDSRDGFVLSLVDGRSTVEMILDISSLPQDETLGCLGKLLTIGAIELHDPPRR